MRRNRNVVTTYSSSDDDGSDSNEDAKSDWVSVQLSELSSMQFSEFGHDGYYSDSFLSECEGETGIDDYECYIAGNLDVQQRILQEGLSVPAAYAAALEGTPGSTTAASPVLEEEAALKRERDVQSLVMRGHLKVVRRPDTYASTLRHPDTEHPHDNAEGNDRKEDGDDSKKDGEDGGENECLASSRKVGVKAKRDDTETAAAAAGEDVGGGHTGGVRMSNGDESNGVAPAAMATVTANDAEEVGTAYHAGRRSSKLLSTDADMDESMDGVASSTGAQSGVSSKKARRSRIDAQVVDMDDIGRPPLGKPPLVHSTQQQQQQQQQSVDSTSRMPYNPRQTLTVVRGLYNTGGIGGGMGPSATPKLTSSVATSRTSTVGSYQTPMVVRREVHLLNGNTPLTQETSLLDVRKSTDGSGLPPSDSYLSAGVGEMSGMNVSHLSDIHPASTSRTGEDAKVERRLSTCASDATPPLQQQGSHSLTANNVQVYHALSPDTSEQSDAMSTLSHSTRLTTTVEVTVHASNMANPSEMFSEMRPPSRRYSMQPRQKRNSSIVASTVSDFMKLVNRTSGNQTQANNNKAGGETKAHSDRSGLPPKKETSTRGRRVVQPTASSLNDSTTNDNDEASMNSSLNDNEAGDSSTDYEKDDVIEAMDMPPKPSTSSPHPPAVSRGKLESGSRTATSKASTRRRVSARPFLEDTLTSGSGVVAQETASMKNSRSSLEDVHSGGNNSDSSKPKPLNSSTYRANTYKRTSKNSVEASVVDDDGAVPTKTSPLSPSKSRTSLQGENATKRGSQPYRLPAVKYLSGSTAAQGATETPVDPMRRVSRSHSPRSSMHPEDASGKLKDTSSSDALHKFVDRAGNGGAGGIHSRYASLSSTNRLTPQETERNVSLSSLPFKSGRLTPIPSTSPFDEGLGHQSKSLPPGGRTGDALGYPRLSIPGNKEGNVKSTVSNMQSTSTIHGSTHSKDHHTEETVPRRSTLRPIHASDSSGTTSRSDHSSRSGTTSRLGQPSESSGTHHTNEKGEDSTMKQGPSQDSKIKKRAQTGDAEKSKPRLQTEQLSVSTSSIPVENVKIPPVPQLMILQEDSGRKRRKASDSKDASISSNPQTESHTAADQPFSSQLKTVQSENSSDTESKRGEMPRKVSSSGRMIRKTSSHRQQPLISDVNFGGSSEPVASKAEDEEKQDGLETAGVCEPVKPEPNEKHENGRRDTIPSNRAARPESASPASPSPANDGSSFPREPEAAGDAEEGNSPQTESPSQRGGVWPDCAPPVVGSYDYGGPTIAGAATPVLPDGMLFMVISAANEYAFYNDTLTHTFYVTFKFTSRITPISEGIALNHAVVPSQRARGSREIREAAQEHFSEIKPGDTVLLFQGLLTNPKVEVSFSTVQRNYVPRPVAENGSMISAAIARIKSKMGSWNKRVAEETLVRCCVKNRVPFIDVHFRPAHRSLCRVGFDEVYIPPLMWMTPQQFLPECFKSNELKSKPVRRLFPAQDVGLSLDGACKGSIDDGGVIGAIVASAGYVEHVHWMFRHPKSVEKGKAERRVGVYRVVLCVNGWWSTYIIDEYLPASRRGPLLAYFGPDLQCQWVSLVEKAYAKALGSYAQLCFGDFDEHLRDLFGYPVRTITPVIQKELKALKERAAQEGNDTHDAHSDLFSYLGQCTRRDLLCVLFTPYSYTLEEDEEVGRTSRTDDIMSASSSVTRRTTGPWQSRSSIHDRSPNPPYWMRGSVSTEDAPISTTSPPRTRQPSQIPPNAVLIEVRSAAASEAPHDSFQTPMRSAGPEQHAPDVVFGSQEPATGGELDGRPSTTASSNTRVSPDTETSDKIARMERPRNRARSQLRQSAQLLVGEPAVQEDLVKIESGSHPAKEDNARSRSPSKLEKNRSTTFERTEGVHFTPGADEHTDGGKSTSSENKAGNQSGKSNVGGIGYGSRLTQRREWSDEELQQIFPPDHPFIVKATLFSRELKQRMVGIKNPWKAGKRNANAASPSEIGAATENRTASPSVASPSPASSPVGLGKDGAQVPLVDVEAAPSAGAGGLRRTLSVGPKSGSATSRFTQSFASASALRAADIIGSSGSADSMGRSSPSSLSITPGSPNINSDDSPSSSKGKQQESEDDLIWIPWSSALRLFCGGSVTYCLKNWCQYRVYGEFENGCSSLVLRIDVSCSVDIMVTLYQEDLRLIATDVDAKGAGGKGMHGRSNRANETAMRMVERRAGYLPILLALSSTSRSPSSASSKMNGSPTTNRSTKQHVIAKSTEDLEAPSSGMHGGANSVGSDVRFNATAGKDAWMFLKERTVTLKMTLVPENGPYYVIPHIHEEIAYDRCRPFSLELLSDQPINTVDSKHDGKSGGTSTSQKGSNVQCRFLSVPHTNPCFALESSYTISLPDEENIAGDGVNPKTSGNTDSTSKRKSHILDRNAAAFEDSTLAKPIETSYQVKTYKGFEEKEGNAIVDSKAGAATS